jgi:2-aminoethylphosphonate-pyruvate transaminase
MSSEPYLLTPGPLTTSLRTRQAMLRDWGSWDVDFNSITGRVRERLLQIVHASGTHECVPLQGSGTFSVEAAIGTLVPRTGHVLVPQNGAYCQRIARICRVLGRKLTTLDYAENAQVTAADIERALEKDASITHVALVHCETSTGILNPLQEIAEVVARRGRGLIVDAMSSFGALEIDARRTPFDAVVAASGKCLEGPPGMGFVIVRRAVLEQCEGISHSLAMDLYDQWVYMQKTTQWRYTPPTHVVAAFDAAITQYLEEGGLTARHARYAHNCDTLISGMARLGLRSFRRRSSSPSTRQIRRATPSRVSTTPSRHAATSSIRGSSRPWKLSVSAAWVSSASAVLTVQWRPSGRCWPRCAPPRDG